MWVKVCGNTNLDDCLRAADLGADAVGFVFAPGKRTVTAAQIAPIVARLPEAIDKIGVFTIRSFDSIVTTVQQAGLTGVQLHGPLDLSLAERLREEFSETVKGCSLFQVVPWWVDTSAEEQRDAFATEVKAAANESVDALLIDSRTRQASGGTGRTSDWSAVRDALTGVQRPVIVAGGLTPENVSEAIGVLAPWGVDVASGVESAPGQKDPAKLAAFVKRARQAGASLNRA